MDDFKNKLLAELERIDNERKTLAGAGAPAGVYDNNPEVPPIEDDYDSLEAEVLEALARIDAGTYGVCARCGKDINPVRLSVLPTATLCRDCAEEEE